MIDVQHLKSVDFSWLQKNDINPKANDELQIRIMIQLEARFALTWYEIGKQMAQNLSIEIAVKEISDAA